MTVIDLSHVIEPGMPVYPGTQGPVFEAVSTIAQDHFAEKRLTMFTHIGTHMDAPAHILPDAPTLDQLPVDRFVGRAVVVDARGNMPGRELSLSLFTGQKERLEGAEFILLRTGWEALWGKNAYFGGYPSLSEEAATWLAGRGLKGLGADFISFDSGATLRNHRILLAAPMVLVENVTNLGALDAISDGFTFACLPLPLAGADGSPVRAVAVAD